MRDLDAIRLSESAHDERILDGGPSERDCGEPEPVECPACDSSGSDDEGNECDWCSGEGVVERE